jgi:hypothetical protein
MEENLIYKEDIEEIIKNNKFTMVISNEDIKAKFGTFCEKKLSLLFLLQNKR